MTQDYKWVYISEFEHLKRCKFFLTRQRVFGKTADCTQTMHHHKPLFILPHKCLTKMLTINFKPKKLFWARTLCHSINEISCITEHLWIKIRPNFSKKKLYHVPWERVIQHNCFCKDGDHLHVEQNNTHQMMSDLMPYLWPLQIYYVILEFKCWQKARVNNVYHTWAPPPHSGRLLVAGILKRPKS